MFRVPPTWKESFTKYPNGFSLMEMLSDWATKANDLKSDVDRKTNLTGDHKGTWQGYHPREVEQGIPGVLEDLENRLEIFENQKMVNVLDFVESTDNHTEAIKAAIDTLKPYDVLFFGRPEGGKYEVGDSTEPFYIDFPVFVEGNGVKIELMPFSNLFTNGGRTTIFQFETSDVVVNNLFIDGNSRNNYIEQNGLKTFYATSDQSMYPNGYSLLSFGVKNGQRSNNIIVRGSKFVDGGGSMVTFSGGHGVNDSFNQNTFQSINNILVTGCYFEKGQLNAVNMNGGIRNALVSDNLFYNCYYHAVRAYFKTSNVTIANNTIYSDNMDMSNFYHKNDGGVSRRQGIRIGHESRDTGTCVNTLVTGNNITLLAPVEMEALAIEVVHDTEHCHVEGNRVRVPYLEGGIRLNQVKDNISVIGNHVTEVHGRRALRISTLENDNIRNIVISNNTFSKNNLSETAGTHGCVEIDRDSRRVVLKDNYFGDIDTGRCVHLTSNTANCLVINNIANSPRIFGDDGNNVLENNRKHENGTNW